VRALELTDVGRSLKPEADRLWGADTRYPTVVVGLAVPREELLHRIEERTRAMFEGGVEHEVARALAGPISGTARKAMGLEDIARLDRGEAVEALNLRSRRYAAYQRKWMRRIPGLVTVAADRPPAEVADEIVEVVRARKRLSARRGRADDA
jgi:tRNA dimethylallyltransferase